VKGKTGVRRRKEIGQNTAGDGEVNKRNIPGNDFLTKQ